MTNQKSKIYNLQKNHDKSCLICCADKEHYDATISRFYIVFTPTSLDVKTIYDQNCGSGNGLVSSMFGYRQEKK